MSHSLLRDPNFHDFLFAADQELAQKAGAAGCPSCGGKLHSANFWRRPRGGLHRRGLRFSFCCAAEGCRKRQTPSSLRFLARRVYLGAIVVLASSLLQGLTPERVERVTDSLGVSERTLVRWRRWWLCDFAQSGFWRGLRGLFAEPVACERLPASLIERFNGDERSRLVGTLRLLLPITGGKGLSVRAC